LFYNWAADRWSYAEVNTELVSTYLSSAIDLDSIDTIITNLDATSLSLDADAFKGGIVSTAAFDTSHKLGNFQGDPLDAVLETLEVCDTRRTFVRNVRPLVDGPNSTVTVSCGTRDQLTSNYSFGMAQGLNSIGEANFRSNARYHRFRVNISGGFTDAMGVEIEAKQGGRR